MDFFSYEGAKRIGSENILVKVDQLIDWSRFPCFSNELTFVNSSAPRVMIHSCFLNAFCLDSGMD